jgi:hypothetical protein
MCVHVEDAGLGGLGGGFRKRRDEAYCGGAQSRKEATPRQAARAALGCGFDRLGPEAA